MRRYAFALWLLFISVPASAQTTPIVSLDCTASTYPSCGGWTAHAPNAFHTRQFVPGAGPEGQDVVQFDLTASGTHGQFYSGWSHNLSAPPATLYLRLKFRVLTPLNLTGNPPEGAWTDKFIILGDGAGTGSRIIVELRPTTAANTIGTRIQRNIDGDPYRTPVRDLTPGVWQALQWEVRSGSQGRLTFWLDGVQVGQSGVFSFGNTWPNVNLGFYNNGSLAPVGRLSYQVAAFEVDDEFDPNWRVGSTPPPPPPVDCVVSAFAFASAGEWGACVNSSQTRTETWTRTVVTPPENGGLACPVLTETRTGTQACTVPPPPPTLTVEATGTTRTCDLTATANASPAGTGWGVQFSRRITGTSSWASHGTRDTSAPYTRTASVALGSWDVRAVWSRSGSASVELPVAVWRCDP